MISNQSGSVVVHFSTLTNLSSAPSGGHDTGFDPDDYIPLPNINDSEKRQDEKKGARKTPKRYGNQLDDDLAKELKN